MAPDVFSPAKRSEIMRKIRGKNSRLDLAMRTILRNANIACEQYPNMRGHPDFLIERVAIFCDSSFWHGRNWPSLKAELMRGSRPEYWVEHIRKNRRRDREVNKMLGEDDYTVLRFWDTDVFKRPGWCLSKINDALRASMTEERRING